MSLYRDSVMLGRIKLPSDVPRDEYVVYALRTQTACVELIEGGDFLADCPIVYSFCGFNDGFIHTLDFPPDTKETGGEDKTQKKLGSQVVLLSVPYYEKPLIIGCFGQLKSTLSLEEEKQLKLYRTSDTGSFLIEGSGLSGLLKMIVTSTKEDGGKFDISAINDYKTGEITFSTNKLFLSGTESVRLLTEKLFEVLIRNVDTNNGGKPEFTTIKYEFGVGFSLIDEFGNEYTTVDGTSTIEAEEIKLGTGASEPVVLGDKLTDILKEIIDGIVAITHPDAMGGTGTPTNVVTFQNIKLKLDGVVAPNPYLSTKSKVE